MATVTSPDRDRQWDKALVLANEARMAAGQVRRDIGQGRKTLAQALDDPAAGPLRALAILSSVPGWGEITAKRALRHLGISESRRVRDFTDRQKRQLVAAVCGVS